MNIYLVVTPFFPTAESFRGAFIYDQVGAISRTNRYDKIVIMRPRLLWHKCSDYKYGDFDVHYFPVVQLPSNLLIWLPDKLNRMLFLSTLNKLGIKCKDISVAHTHVSMNACYALAVKSKNQRVKTIIQFHDPDPYSINMSRLFAEWKWNAIMNSKYLIGIFEKMDLYVSVSRKVEHNLLSFPNPGLEEVYERYSVLLRNVCELRKVRIRHKYVLYNGVDTRKFFRMQTHERKKFRIGCIANFLEWKDQRTLLKSLLVLPGDRRSQIEVVFVGSGPMLEECKDFVSEQSLDGNVIFLEEMNHEKLCEFYNSLDLFILPSYFEGFGCVFTEAYACGVPFMTCKNQGVSEIVDEPEKWLIEKEDFEGLAKLILNYIKYRPEQSLNHEYRIDKLVPAFLDYVDNM